MVIHEPGMAYFVNLIRAGQTFSLVGYSDAEWYSILGVRAGERTGLGQVLSPEHGRRLLDVLKRRAGSPKFLFAVPKVLRTLPGMAEGQIDWLLGRHNVSIEAYERDELLDDLARDAGLFPFIQAVREKDLSLVGPAPLRGMEHYLPVRHFTEISTPNLHMEENGIENAVADVLSYGKPGVYCVSAGVSAAVIIDQLHDRMPPGTWLIDCGSIWDAFVGIGGQREWRARLYEDPEALEHWKNQNLTGLRSKGK